MAVADKIDLTNVNGSMTNIIHNNADKLYAAQSVRELHDILLSIFRENHLDTEASRRLLIRVIEKRTVKQGLDAIFNSYFKGANMGRDKEKVGGKPKMFKIDEKLKKIVSEDIEKIEVETSSEEITVETEGDAVKVEIEPKATECVDCEAPVEAATIDTDDYAFFSDLDPEIDIDDFPVDAEPDEIENVEENLFKESAQGTYSMRMYDYIDEYLDNEGRKDLCYAFTKWLSDDEVHEFAKANDLVPVFEDEEDLYEGIEKKYVKPLKDKIDACYTKQDLDEIGAYLDDFSDKDIDRILSGKVSNKDINKMFGGYNFVDDDFPGWDFKESKSIKNSKRVVKESFEKPVYEKVLYLPTPNGKVETHIFAFEDERDYGDMYEEDTFEVAVTGVLDTIEAEFELDSEKLESNIVQSGCTYLTALFKDEAIDAVDKLYEYFMHLDQFKIIDTLLELCDEYSVYDIKRMGNINESKSIKESDTNNTEIRCANAQYEDDDGYICNVGIYAADLNFEELTDILYDAGMLYVDVYDEYTRLYPSTYVSNLKPGKVVDVFDTDDDIINDFCANNDLDPEDYKHIGFFENKKTNRYKSIRESLSVAEFIDWHETTNYKDNENTFEAVYSILDKYPESEDDVKAQYTAASDEDKEAISRIIDKANETATEEPTVYLARAMHKMYVDGYNYQEIADTLGAPVSLVIKMIGPDSYDESLNESLKESIDVNEIEDDLYFRGMRGEFGYYEDTVAYRMCDRAEDMGMAHDDAYELAWKVVNYMSDRRFSFEPGEDPEA